ncbi:hypothetical protein CASFOL_008070 [Castilleja foliolosa]|uniref:Phytocyanin domain-containing protein n=1 Tax=Castilleja foliolosa TaxID=1961234 RepID=A0ABD3DZN8_9LAMI
MALNCPLTTSFVFLILMSFLCYSNAHTFFVGGDDGWSLHPSENYNHWSDRYRFSINDELVFRYKKGHDSVLVVNQNDYTRCNKENPIKALKKGDDESRFKLQNSGPHFFISGHNQNCEKGQKLKLNVLSPRHHHKINYTAPSQPPQIPLQPLFSSAPSPSSHIAPTPSPAIDHSPSPSPAAEAPSHVSPEMSPSPSPAPSNPNLLNSHSLSFSLGTKTQTHAPPSHSPSPSPSPATKTWSNPIEPPSHSPSPSPTIKNPTQASPPSHTSPTPASPVVKIQTHAPPPHVQPPSHSPSPKAESPIETSGAPQNHHHAPAPAPSAASYFGVSLAPLITGGLSLVAIIISVV